MNNQTGIIINTTNNSSTSAPRITKDVPFVYNEQANFSFYNNASFEINKDSESLGEISKEDKDRFYKMTLQSDLL